MKIFTWVAGFALVLNGCASTAPATAWGKPGVSKQNYGTDVGMCAGLAVKLDGGNGANTAGGIDGKTMANTSNPAVNAAAPPAGAGTGAQTTHVDAPLPSNGSYSGMASADFAQRAPCNNALSRPRISWRSSSERTSITNISTSSAATPRSSGGSAAHRRSSQAGITSKAAVSRRPPSANGTVPCQKYDGNRTS